MSKFKDYLIDIQEIRPDLTPEDIEDFFAWLKDNHDETESLTSAVNRYFPQVSSQCGI